MRILTRYLFREHAAPFFYSMMLIIFIFVLNLVFQMLGKIAGKGLDLHVIAEFFFLNLAWIIAMAVPMAVLVAVLMSFGRFSADNEITALKASGVSLYRLIRPLLIWATILCGLLILFNNDVLPYFNHKSRLLRADIRRKRPTLIMEQGIFLFDIPNTVLYARKVDQQTSTMEDVVIYDESEKKVLTTITAKRGELKFSASQEKYLFTLWDGEIHREDLAEDTYQKTIFQRALFRINAPDIVLQRSESEYRSDRELSVGEMRAKVKQLSAHPLKNQRLIDSYLVEINKKYSIPVACLVFVLLGVPLGIRAHRGGIGVSGGLSVFFFLLYWVFLIGGEDLADRNYVHPAVAMWAPNVILGILGIYLTIQAVRQTTFFNWEGLQRFLPKPLRPRSKK
jgi:lipopolysaccharide export system permease protein